jgi:hypothetical protein
MADNNKMPPNQDPRQRTPQSDPNKSQKQGGPGSSAGNPDRTRQGSNMPGKPGPGQGQDMDPDRSRTQKPMPGSDKDSVSAPDSGIDDLDEDEDAMPRTQQPDRGTP